MKVHSRKNHFTALMWDILRDKLESELPKSAMTEWIDHFELIGLTAKKARVLYIGNENLELFYEQYYNQFAACLFDLLNQEVEIEFKQKRTKALKNRTVLKRAGFLVLGILLIAAVCAVLVACVNVVENQSFQETFYQLGACQLNDSIRILQLSDLHETSYGTDNEKLIDRIEKLQPDLIVMTGDMINQNDDDYSVVVQLCAKLTEIAPVYYVYGNNEEHASFGSSMTLQDLDDLLGCTEEDRDIQKIRELDDPLRDALEDAGVHVLLNEMDTVEVNGNQVDVYGVLTANPSAFWPYAEESYAAFLYENTQHFKLMLCHEPLIFKYLDEGNAWADLVLCGDTHGGVIRLPLVGGLYARGAGLLPELKDGNYVYGLYSVGGEPLIVSSGLTNRGLIRINNQPELVIVDVNRY